MHKILVVEDSPESFELIKRALSPSVQIEWAKTIREASQKIDSSFHLLILDVMLPDGDGYHLCSLLQASDMLRSVPIIFLSAKNTISDKVMGLTLGAEDFICKPFDMIELKARIEAKLKKRDRERAQADILRVHDLEINKSSQRVTCFEEGAPVSIDLTPIEFKILVRLAAEPGVVVSRDEMLNTVWGENVHVYGRSVDTHISKLRKKLGSRARLIDSVHGTGYRMAVEEISRSPLISCTNTNSGLQPGMAMA